MNLSRHFDDNEKNVACNCGCGFKKILPHLLAVLELVRIHFNKPVSFNSVCRCHEHNEKVQKEANPKYIEGTSKSQHMLGTAADIVVRGVDPRKVTLFLRDVFPESYGIGDYKTFTHIDVRDTKARWSR